MTSGRANVVLVANVNVVITTSKQCSNTENAIVDEHLLHLDDEAVCESRD
jgi:hypothetical protein